MVSKEVDSSYKNLKRFGTGLFLAGILMDIHAVSASSNAGAEVKQLSNVASGTTVDPYFKGYTQGQIDRDRSTTDWSFVEGTFLEICGTAVLVATGISERHAEQQQLGEKAELIANNEGI